MSASRCRFETSKTSSMSAALTSAMRRSEPQPPQPDRLLADVNAALMEEVFDVSKRQREADIHHHGQSNDLGRRLKVPKWAMGHGAANLRLTGRSDKPRCLDTALLSTTRFCRPRFSSLSRSEQTLWFIPRPSTSTGTRTS